MLYKTVNEVRLEDRIRELEVENYQLRYRRHPYANGLRSAEPISTMEYTTVTLPMQVRVAVSNEDTTDRRYLGVTARVWGTKPFALAYYCDAHLLTNEQVAAQVLGLQHELFIHKLAKFVSKENKEK